MYTPSEILIPTTFDEIGLRLGLRRFPNETLPVFRRRLLLELRNPSGPTANDVANTIGRKVGLFDTLLGYIDPGNASDPCCKITPNQLILWDDYANDSKQLELNLLTDGKFVQDVIDAINNTDDFTINYIADVDYELSKLRIGMNLLELKLSDLPPNYVLKLVPRGVLRQIWASNPVVFQTLVEVDSVNEEGEFALTTSSDYEMTITTASIMTGTIVAQYTQWPMPLFWTPTRSWSPADHFTSTSIDNGFITAEGEEVLRELFHAAPWEWGL